MNRELKARNSAATIVGDQDFNLEKHLKDIIKRYVQDHLINAQL